MLDSRRMLSRFPMIKIDIVCHGNFVSSLMIDIGLFYYHQETIFANFLRSVQTLSFTLSTKQG